MSFSSQRNISSCKSIKPHERLILLDNCLKSMFKQFSKNLSPIECSMNANLFWDDNVMSESDFLTQNNSEKAIQSDSEKTAVLKRYHFSNWFYRHPRVNVKCCLCDEMCPSESSPEQMMILYNSPSPISPLCSSCAITFGKKTDY